MESEYFPTERVSDNEIDILDTVEANITHGLYLEESEMLITQSSGQLCLSFDSRQPHQRPEDY